MTDTATEQTHGSAPGEKGLKKGALGLISSVVIGVASTAPAYSLAATLGFVIAILGFRSPGILVLAFVPMLFIAYSFRELNKVDPDCGTTFTWATRAFGPWVGWMGGWGIIAADIIVMASLSQITGRYVFLLFGSDSLANNRFWITVVGVAFIVLMTYIVYRGIEVSARVQYVLLAVEVFALVLFSAVALIKVYSGHATAASSHPHLGWFNPWDGSFSDLSNAFILAIFIYWGWDTAVSVNEETKDSARTPGRAAVISTVLLVAIYAVVSMSALAYMGTDALSGNPDILGAAATAVLGTTAGKLLIICVLTSAAASTQTTILPTARATLSMAAYQALPASFAKIHPKYQTPAFSTIAMGTISVIWFVGLSIASASVLADAASGTGLTVAFYYGLTGFACVWFFRKDLTNSAHDLWFKGILPLAGGVTLLGSFILSIKNYYPAGNSASSFHGIGGIFLISAGGLLLGVPLLFLTRWRSPAFFRGEVLNRDTPIQVQEGEPRPVAALTLPDSPSQEQTVIPPLSVEELRAAEAEARESARDERAAPHSEDPGD